jgi:hypothetical protein
MADAALLDLLKHLNWHPPALISHAPMAAGGKALERAFETTLDQTEREMARWTERGLRLRDEIWKSLSDEDSDLTPESVDGLIGMVERQVRAEARAFERMKRLALRDERSVPLSELEAHRRLNARALALAGEFYRHSQDFLLFLRAVRAEIDPDARGGPSFDNAADLEAYLLTGTA